MPFIQNILYKNISFDTSRKNWETIVFPAILDEIFESQDKNIVITISRKDLLNDQSNLETCIIKVLMWGYPTKGSGINILNFLANSEGLPTCVKKFKRSPV